MQRLIILKDQILSFVHRPIQSCPALDLKVCAQPYRPAYRVIDFTLHDRVSIAGFTPHCFAGMTEFHNGLTIEMFAEENLLK
jgi:hypothetical protein